MVSELSQYRSTCPNDHGIKKKGSLGPLGPTPASARISGMNSDSIASSRAYKWEWPRSYTSPAHKSHGLPATQKLSATQRMSESSSLSSRLAQSVGRTSILRKARPTSSRRKQPSSRSGAAKKLKPQSGCVACPACGMLTLAAVLERHLENGCTLSRHIELHTGDAGPSTSLASPLLQVTQPLASDGVVTSEVVPSTSLLSPPSILGTQLLSCDPAPSASSSALKIGFFELASAIPSIESKIDPPNGERHCTDSSPDSEAIGGSQYVGSVQGWQGISLPTSDQRCDRASHESLPDGNELQTADVNEVLPRMLTYDND